MWNGYRYWQSKNRMLKPVKKFNISSAQISRIKNNIERRQYVFLAEELQTAR